MQTPSPDEWLALKLALSVIGGLAGLLGTMIIAVWRSISKDVRGMREDIKATRRTQFNAQMSTFRLLADLNPDPKHRKLINDAVLDFAEKNANPNGGAKPNGKANGAAAGGYH